MLDYYSVANTEIHSNGDDSGIKNLSQQEINNAAIRKSLLCSPLFSDLSHDLQNDLLAMGTICRWKRNEYLFMDGDTVESVYYLVSGKIKEYYCNGSGDEYLRRIFGPGCYISLHSVINKEQYHTYSCVAVQASDCLVLPGKPFFELLKREAKLSLKVAVLLSRDYENSCRKNCLCKKSQAIARVAGYLLSKQEPACTYPPPGVVPPRCHCNIKCCQNQVDLRPLELAASDICLARETFSRALLILQERNIVRNRRGVVDILEKDTLKVMCGIE